MKDKDKEAEDLHESHDTSMASWCTSYKVPADDELNKEIRRSENVNESGLFGTSMQFNFAPKLFTFPDKANKTVDRILVYSVPSEKDGQTVKFFVCNLEQTVLTIKGVYAIVNMVKNPDPDQSNERTEFIVTLLAGKAGDPNEGNTLIQGTIELPVGQNFSSKEDFVREDYEYHDFLKYEKRDSDTEYNMLGFKRN